MVIRHAQGPSIHFPAKMAVGWYPVAQTTKVVHMLACSSNPSIFWELSVLTIDRIDPPNYLHKSYLENDLVKHEFLQLINFTLRQVSQGLTSLVIQSI